MSATVAPTSPGSTPSGDSPLAWYSLEPEAAAARLDVDPAVGLTSAESAGRAARYGPNALSGRGKDPFVVAFLKQYRDFMQLLLVGTAALAAVFLGDFRTMAILLGLTLFNAVMGLQQEAKAQASVAALQKMLKSIARVRRDGKVEEIDPAQLVPGDIALVEAGDRIPADGRLLVAASLEVDEGTLTGESVPTIKSLAAVSQADLALGDQASMVFMNTTVTKGRAEFAVTGTGMATQIGRVAVLLDETSSDKTPLQQQLDRLTLIVAAMAGLAMLGIIGLGLQRGETVASLFFIGITLAIAAVPTGMPVVVTTLYSLGTREMARRGAIIKRLPAVETLGSVTVICSDKTGTLTLNKMTAREFVLPGDHHHYSVSGEGYSTVGTISRVLGAPADLDPYLTGLALCADASLRDGELIGDPTEGALIVLAAKSGLDLQATRARFPRIAEVPFDASYKFMATFHRMPGDGGDDVVRAYVKGAPDVLVARGARYRRVNGDIIDLTAEDRQTANDENDRMASAGERVMVVAQRDFDAASFDPAADHLDEIRELTLLAMIGIVDPPRPEARVAIAECHAAGIRVRMITGDHVVTARAIAEELGITGTAMLGSEFVTLSDEQLKAQLPDIGVVARVTPEDKLRMVDLLQQTNNIVAMTGDGVNDAPALKKADIGVAMGITGTEVSKDAAVMVLTDDNFATIVKAVEYGRGLYERLVRYIRFQMFSLIGFIVLFIGAGVVGILGGQPLLPLQVLFIGFGVDALVSIALGLREASSDSMEDPPRRVGAPVLTLGQWLRVSLLATYSAVAAVAVATLTGSSIDDQTLILVTFALTHLLGALSFQREWASVFSSDIIQDRLQLMLYAGGLVLIVLVTELGLLRRIFSTETLPVEGWLLAFAVGLSVLFIDELIKLIVRPFRRRRGLDGTTAAPVIRPV